MLNILYDFLPFLDRTAYRVEEGLQEADMIIPHDPCVLKFGMLTIRLAPDRRSGIQCEAEALVFKA